MYSSCIFKSIRRVCVCVCVCVYACVCFCACIYLSIYLSIYLYIYIYIYVYNIIIIINHSNNNKDARLAAQDAHSWICDVYM